MEAEAEIIVAENLKNAIDLQSKNLMGYQTDTLFLYQLFAAT